MGGFRFRLQKILELRARLEKESASRLNTARVEADVAQRAMETLELARRESSEEVGRAGGATIQAGELQRLSLFVQQLDLHLAVASEAMDEADARVDDMQSEFKDALTRRRVLDNLREKHLGLWKTEESQRDRATMDAIALARHASKRAGEGS
jgi:flagellar FliJ protein